MNKIFLLFLFISMLIHIMILAVPLNLPKSNKIITDKFFIVDLIKNQPTADKIDIDKLLKEPITKKVKEYIGGARNKDLNNKIPTIANNFDLNSYHLKFLEILHKQMDIKDYLEKTGLEGEYLFQIEIEGSGRIRDVKTLRSKGSQQLEEYVIKRLKTIVFPPHGELVITIKVNMKFELE